MVVRLFVKKGLRSCLVWFLPSTFDRSPTKWKMWCVPKNLLEKKISVLSDLIPFYRSICSVEQDIQMAPSWCHIISLKSNTAKKESKYNFIVIYQINGVLMRICISDIYRYVK